MEKETQRSLALDVQVDVDAAVLVQEEQPHHIGALDAVPVSIIQRQILRIVLCYSAEDSLKCYHPNKGECAIFKFCCLSRMQNTSASTRVSWQEIRGFAEF